MPSINNRGPRDSEATSRLELMRCGAGGGFDAHALIVHADIRDVRWLKRKFQSGSRAPRRKPTAPGLPVHRLIGVCNLESRCRFDLK